MLQVQPASPAKQRARTLSAPRQRGGRAAACRDGAPTPGYKELKHAAQRVSGLRECGRQQLGVEERERACGPVHRKGSQRRTLLRARLSRRFSGVEQHVLAAGKGCRLCSAELHPLAAVRLL